MRRIYDFEYNWQLHTMDKTHANVDVSLLNINKSGNIQRWHILHVFYGAIPVYTGLCPKVKRKIEYVFSASGDMTRYGSRLCQHGSNILVTRPWKHKIYVMWHFNKNDKVNILSFFNSKTLPWKVDFKQGWHWLCREHDMRNWCFLSNVNAYKVFYARIWTAFSWNTSSCRIRT